MADQEINEMNAQIDIELVLPLQAYRKIMAYTMTADSEISGFADVDYDKENRKLVVGEVYLLKQISSGAHTNIDEDVVSDFNLSLVKKGKTQMPRLWWHSHHTMGVFFSGTDTDTMDYLENDSFIVALVVNQNREMRADFILNNPIKVKVENIPIHINVEYEEIPATILKEVASKLNKPKKSEPVIIIGKPDDESEKKGGDIYVPNQGEDWDRKRKIFSSRQSYQWLPKDPIEAEERIRNLNLTMQWSADLDQYIYVQDNGQAWVDYWNALGTLQLNEKDLN